MTLLLLACAASFLLTFWALRTRKLGFWRAHDTDLSGPQKFHEHPVPRIGGLGIVGGIAAGALLLAWQQPELGRMAGLLLLCALPAFLAGLAEDLTKNVSPGRRLLFTAISAALGVWLLGAVITYTAIPGVDWLVAFPLGAALVTIVAVTGVANAVNIIDGFNGLASMCVVLMLAALAVVAYDIGDVVVGQLALVTIGAVLGFFILNYPAGLIFLGDGGAYFLGFWYAELSLLLLARNPGALSPLFPVLVCVYPAFETIFSVYRRRIRGHAASQADGVHLHSLIYRRFLRWAVGDADARALTRSNSMTAPYLWLLSMSAVVPAVLFYEHTWVMLLFIGLFIVSYLVLYWRIVRFRTPGWIRHTTAVLAARLEAARAGEGGGK